MVSNSTNSINSIYSNNLFNQLNQLNQSIDSIDSINLSNHSIEAEHAVQFAREAADAKAPRMQSGSFAVSNNAFAVWNERVHPDSSKQS